MTATRITLPEFQGLPDDGTRHELVAGELTVTPAPGERHARIVTRIAWLMYSHVERIGTGSVYTDLGFLLGREPETVRVPDVAFVARSVASDRWLEGAPELAIEVISPNDRRRDVDAKARMWIEAGACVVLVIDPPSETVTVHRRAGNTESLGGDSALDLADVVPGWSPRAASFFE